MKNKVIIIFSIIITVVLLLCYYALPFVLVEVAYAQPNRRISSKYFEKAVSYSHFRHQKVYTIEAIMPNLILAQRYDVAIEYYKQYKAASGGKSFMSPTITLMAAQAYFQKGDNNTALKLGEEINNEFFIAKVCVKTKNYKRAMEISQNILKSNRPEVRKELAYLYIGQIQMSEGEWKEANKSIDKVLHVTPENIEALNCKIQIAKKLGNNSDYNKYSAQLKQVEEKRKKWRNE